MSTILDQYQHKFAYRPFILKKKRKIFECLFLDLFNVMDTFRKSIDRTSIENEMRITLNCQKVSYVESIPIINLKKNQPRIFLFSPACLSRRQLRKKMNSFIQQDFEAVYPIYWHFLVNSQVSTDLQENREIAEVREKSFLAIAGALVKAMAKEIDENTEIATGEALSVDELTIWKM